MGQNGPVKLLRNKATKSLCTKCAGFFYLHAGVPLKILFGLNAAD